MTVLIKKGTNASAYHKPNKEGKPRCLVNDNDEDCWHEWEVEKAKVWRDPCQNPQCYGSGKDGTPGAESV